MYILNLALKTGLDGHLTASNQNIVSSNLKQGNKEEKDIGIFLELLIQKLRKK